MKRKVIQLAGKTSVISLPSKWIKLYGVKKGDELDIDELGNTLVVKQLKQSSEVKRVSLKIDAFNERTFRYCISALHKSGYDEIVLFYESPKLGEVIQHLLQNLLLGFVVIEQTSKKLVLKNVASEIESEFDPTLKRAFLVTLSLADSSLEMVNSGQFSGLKSLINLENSNNQLTSFCLRLMNKGFYKNTDGKLFLTTIIWGLEKIADEYKAICVGLSSNISRVNSEILEIYKNVNGLFRDYYGLFYGFSADKLNELVDRKKNIEISLSKLRASNDYESSLLNNLYAIISKTSDLSSSIFALNYGKILNY